MKKIKTITLTSGHLRPEAEARDQTAFGYRVEQVTDSTEFSPGKILTKNEVDELCAARDWRVTIKASK